MNFDVGFKRFLYMSPVLYDSINTIYRDFYNRGAKFTFSTQIHLSPKKEEFLC